MKQFEVASNLDDKALDIVRVLVRAYRRIDSLCSMSPRPFCYESALDDIDAIIDDINFAFFQCDSSADLIPFVEED